MRWLFYINVLMGQWESVGREVQELPNVCSKPVAEVLGLSAFFVTKEFRLRLITMKSQQD